MPATRRPDAEPAIAIIVGPTASGKSELAIAVAERLDAEILSADSRQVYRGMDIGTAKPSAADRARVPHHLLDFVDPDDRFTAAAWVGAARERIADISARGKLPLVVGGTGLYVTALLEGYDFGGMPPSAGLRAQLGQELALSGIEPLAARLAARSPELAARTDLRNPRRVVRALERLAGTGGGQPRSHAYRGPVGVIGLERPREVLIDRIHARTRAMFEAGLVDETRRLAAAGFGPDLPSMSGIGYRETLRHLAGEWSPAAALDATDRRTRQYAKRQLTWFRRDERIRWVPMGDRPIDAAAVDEVARLLYRANG